MRSSSFIKVAFRWLVFFLFFHGFNIVYIVNIVKIINIAKIILIYYEQCFYAHN